MDANSFSLGRRKMTALNLASSATIAAPKADSRRRSPDCGRVGSKAGCGSGGGADTAENRPGQPHAGLRERVLTQGLRRDHGAHKRDEHRRAGLQPLAPQGDHVAQLVHEQQRDEAGGERPAPQQCVGGERDQDRAGRGEQLQLRRKQQDRLELGEQGDDRRADRRQPAPERRLRARLGSLLALRPRLLRRRNRSRQPLRVRIHCNGL